VPWRARDFVQHQLRRRAGRPQLKRDPLGRSATHPGIQPVQQTMRFTPSLLTAAIIAAMCAVPALAQDTTAAKAWANAAIGYGAAHFSCDTCEASRHVNGWDVIVAVGAIPTRHLRVGIMLNIWDHTLSDGERLRETTTASAWLYYYPLARRTFFFEGGIGLSDYRFLKGLQKSIFFENADTTYAKGTGIGGTLGAGWDIYIGRSGHFALSPRIAYVHGFPRTLHSPSGAIVARRWTQDEISADLVFAVN
jgi:hypothetical protein